MAHRRWQGQTHGLARNTRFTQPSLGDLTTLSAGQRHRQISRRHGMGRIIRQNRFFRQDIKIPVRLHEPDTHTARQIGLGFARLLQTTLKIRTDRQLRRRQRGGVMARAHDELQHPIPLDRIKRIAQHEWLQGTAGRRNIVHHISTYIAIKGRGVISTQTSAITDFTDNRRQRTSRSATRNPMTTSIVFPIRPRAQRIGKKRIGPRVPCPHKSSGHVHHRRAIAVGHRIIFRIRPIGMHRAQILLLDQIIARTVRIFRQTAFG